MRLLSAARLALQALRAWNELDIRDLDDAEKARIRANYERSTEIQALVQAIAEGEDARLIAKAPELLVTVKEFVRIVHHGQHRKGYGECPLCNTRVAAKVLIGEIEGAQ